MATAPNKGRKKANSDLSQRTDAKHSSGTSGRDSLKDTGNSVDKEDASIQAGGGLFEYLALQVLFCGREKELAPTVSILQKQGYAASLQVDPIEARQFIAEHIDTLGVIILQAQQSGSDTPAFIKELRAEFLLDCIPIIVLTPNSNVMMVDKFVQSGATDVMQLPISWELLSKKLRLYLQMARYDLSILSDEHVTAEEAVLEKIIESVQRAHNAQAEGSELPVELISVLKAQLSSSTQSSEMIALKKVICSMTSRETSIQQELKSKNSLLHQKEKEVKGLHIKLNAFKHEHEAVKPGDIPGSVAALANGFKEPLDVLLRQIFHGLQRTGILASDIKFQASKVTNELEASEPRRFRKRTSTIMPDGLDEQTKTWLSANFANSEEPATPMTGHRKSIVGPELMARRSSRFIPTITGLQEEGEGPRGRESVTMRPPPRRLSRAGSSIDSEGESQRDSDYPDRNSENEEKSPTASTMTKSRSRTNLSSRRQSNGSQSERRRSFQKSTELLDPQKAVAKYKNPELSMNHAELWVTNVDPELVDALTSWSFNPFDLTEPQMIMLSVTMFEQLGIMEAYDVNDAQLAIFLNDVRTNYHKNPYHNFVHAFDVMQTCFSIVMGTPLRDVLTPLEKYALMIGAVCHDLDHPGLNNNFQINSRTELATIYNDASILENHHASLTFRLLQMRSCPLVSFLSKEEFNDFRKIVIQEILNTDMAVHFSLTERFCNLSKMTTVSDLQSDQIRLLLNTILHIADISNPAKCWDISKAWSDNVLEEFLNQGDLEKKNKFPVSPFMDRDSVDQVKMSLGFIDFVVKPLFMALRELLRGVIDDAISNLEENRSVWASMIDPSKAPPPPPPSNPKGSEKAGEHDRDGSRGHDAPGSKRQANKIANKKKKATNGGTANLSERESHLAAKALVALNNKRGGSPTVLNKRPLDTLAAHKAKLGLLDESAGSRPSASAPSGLSGTGHNSKDDRDDDDEDGSGPEDAEVKAATAKKREHDKNHQNTSHGHNSHQQHPQSPSPSSPNPRLSGSATPSAGEKSETRRNLLLIATKQRSRRLVEEMDESHHEVETVQHATVDYASPLEETDPETSTSDELSLVGRKTRLSLPPITTYQPSHHRGPH
eukprot:TRINITY_DN9462_c0_g2_i2.p1 TRINITY_DN9462_c0_g2~~TRINITY_DN9462_c0_g2_i2.p1  ORF type:complete len:1118 (+),score=211.18 TRINITY_DN9462_c0_g2_i2:69-3422(+)